MSKRSKKVVGLGNRVQRPSFRRHGPVVDRKQNQAKAWQTTFQKMPPDRCACLSEIPAVCMSGILENSSASRSVQWKAAGYHAKLAPQTFCKDAKKWLFFGLYSLSRI